MPARKLGTVADDRRWYVDVAGEDTPRVTWAPTAIGAAGKAAELGYRDVEVRPAPPVLEQPDEIPLRYLTPRNTGTV